MKFFKYIKYGDNMVTCKKCGEEMPDEAKFCKNCGSELEQTQEANTKFCPHCGGELPGDDNFCPECGKSLSGEIESVQTPTVRKNKSPFLAAILSFFIIGLGQVYLGLVKKGILLFVLAIIAGILTLVIIGWLLWFVIWIYAIYDAITSANKINDGIEVEDSLFN